MIDKNKVQKHIKFMETGEDLPYDNWVDMMGYADRHGLSDMSDALDDNFEPNDDAEGDRDSLLIAKNDHYADSSDVFATCKHNIDHYDTDFNAQYN